MASPVPQSHPRGAALMLAVVAVVALAGFVPSLGHAFVHDDVFLIPRNPAVNGEGAWHAAVTAPYWPGQFCLDPLYRPVTTLTLRLNWLVSGESALGYRIVNLLLHAAAAMIAALMARRLWRSDAAGWLAGLLFAAHPLHADAVALTVGRAELLAALFVGLMLVRHLGRPCMADRHATRYHLTTAILFAAALGSKEHAVFALPAIACIDCWRRREFRANLGLRGQVRYYVASHYLGLILVLAGFFLARWALFGGRTTLPADLVDPLSNPMVAATWTTKLATPLVLVLLTVQQWLMPVNLCPIWSVGSFPLPGSFARSDVILGGVLLVVLLWWTVQGLRKRRPLGLLAALALCFLLLPCHFFPAANWLYAERWVYLPSLIFAVTAGGLLRRGGRPVAWMAIAVVSLALTASTWAYQRCWADNETLMRAVVSRQPYNYKGLLGLVSVLDRTGRFDQAEPYIECLVTRYSQARQAWYYQAKRMANSGRWPEAMRAVLEYAKLAGPMPLPPTLQRIHDTAAERLQTAPATNSNPADDDVVNTGSPR